MSPILFIHSRQARVPDVLFSTVERIRELPTVGQGCFLQARICRAKREARGESNAKEISDVSEGGGGGGGGGKGW